MSTFYTSLRFHEAAGEQEKADREGSQQRRSALYLSAFNLHLT